MCYFLAEDQNPTLDSTDKMSTKVLLSLVVSFVLMSFFHDSVYVTCNVVAFSAGDYKGWETWNWTTITHLGFWTAPPSDVRAKAKENKVRLFQDSHLPDPDHWTDSSARKSFALEKVAQVKSAQLDGVFFDYEGNELSSDQKKAYSKLAEEVASQLKPLNATIFVCVGGRPTYELRDYDYKGLAEVSEFLFIMGYDMHFWDDYTCVVENTCSPAEASIVDLTAGVKEYLEQVSASKLVLGLPWYGQIYTEIIVPISEGSIKYSDVLGVFDAGRVAVVSYF